MNLGIGSYTYSWAVGVPGYSYPDRRMGVLELIDKAAELGVGVVQICDNLPLDRLNMDDLRELKRKADNHSIQLEVGTRGVEPEHIRKYLDIAAFLEARLLRVILHQADRRLTIEEAYTKIQQVLPDLEKRNIRLAIENHERHTTKELKQLITGLKHELVGICLDTVNSFGALEGPDQVIEELSPYMINLHYKDFTISRLEHMMGFQVTGCPAGQGMLQADRLKQHGKGNKDLSVILELWTPFSYDVENTLEKEDHWAKESIKYLKEWIR